MKKSALLLFALVTVFMFSGCEIYSVESTSKCKITKRV